MMLKNRNIKTYINYVGEDNYIHRKRLTENHKHKYCNNQANIPNY